MYYLRRLTLLTILLTLLFIVILPAHAGNATVSTCDFASLQAAVTIANTGGGTITFNCSGTINFTGELTINADITINANGNTVIFDGGNTTRHFYVNSGVVFMLNDFTLQNGSVGGADGGSIYNAGTFIATNVTFLNNGNGTHRGGAIHTASTGSTTVNISTFSGNKGAYGGAIHSFGTVDVQCSTFSSNGGGGTVAGGAIYNEAGTLNITMGASFTSNQAEYGGAIYAFNGTTDISSAFFTNNTATTDTTTGAYYNGNSGFSSQFADYIGNTCGGPNPVIDNGGNTRDAASVGCPGSLPTVTLSASAVCIGADLQVTISAGDPNFQITADSGTLLTGLSVGTHTITGPLTETNVNVTELGGNTENFLLGDFNCFASSTLAATAVCVGADLHVTITNGNAPFTVNVTNTSGVMSMGSVALGTYTFTGPDTFANIKVIEESGDLETLSLAGVTCSGSLVLSPTVVLSPDTTALGCTLTADVEAFGMTDNTYCRLLMKNGGVIKFPGAVPQNLINLGVILAVDVYRLQGGQSITDFGGYSRVCLAGEGRLFYLDARTSPRAQVELATESLDGMTCGWIPAAGTLVLTN